MRRRFVLLMLSLAVAPVACAQTPPASVPTSVATTLPATAPATLFDPARHMRVSEVCPGMKGYGLTVLSGTKIDRFDVEVISTLHNSFGPQQDVVMIRCLGATMEHLGPIAGCSGSPIYLYDDSGKARLIGAYAFGFDTAKDPIVGVQPIEYMMRLTKPPAGADDTATTSTSTAQVPTSWSLLESDAFRALLRDASAVPSVPHRRQGLPPSRDEGSFKPLAVPLAVRGLDESALATLRPMFRANGLEPMLAVGSAATSATTQPTIEPGSVLGAAVLSGDIELTALGTCTEVIDGRAFGFGHPFNGEGATSIPMGAGSINLVMPLLTSSFKLGGLTGTTGAIDIDGTPGIAGQIGAVAKTVPVEVEVRDGDTGVSRRFHYQAAQHRTFTPMMVAAALQASVVAGHQLPVEHTATYSVTMKFAGGRSLTINNIATSLEGFDLARDGVWPVSIAMDNPFGNVLAESVSATVDIRRGARVAAIEAATPAQPTYRPGETARVNVRLRKYKGDAFLKAIDVPLPSTLKDGDYTITVDDATSNLAEDMTARPERMAVRSVDELFATMNTLAASGRNDALYVRLGGMEPGIAIGRTPLTKLPPSRRAMLGESGRPDIAAMSDVRVSAVPMELVVSGSAEATIHVKKKLP